jgi:hypothetical protein
VQEAVAELRDKLIAAMGSAESSLEQEFDQVFDAYRDGLAQRLAWLATIDPSGETVGPATIMRDIADSLHARRTAAAPAGAAPDRADTEMLVHLIAVAAFGDAIVGRRLWRSAELPATDDTDRRFRAWLAALIRDFWTRR